MISKRSRYGQAIIHVLKKNNSGNQKIFFVPNTIIYKVVYAVIV